MKYRIAVLLVSVITLINCKQKKQPLEPIEDSYKQNVVFILVDDLGWRDLGCYGSTFYETPNIDRLASQSAVFTNAYTPSPVCSPTRASILTGKYPSRIGITDWIPGDDPKDRELLGPTDLNQLPLEETTLAEALKTNGYKTFFAGKWHLGHSGFFPEDQGFNINKGGHHRGSPPGGYYSPYNNPKLSDGPDGEYLTDRLVDESILFLEENEDNSFLLYLSFYSVHTPIQANKRHISKFEEKRKKLKDSLPLILKEGNGHTLQNQYNADYASMVYAMDENVGRVIKKLEDLDLMENTLIIFTSDNGGLSTLESTKWEAPTSVKPLRGGKGWAYEGGIRVPLIIKKPESKEELKIDAPVISMDFYPTILEVLQLEPIPEQHIDGISLSPLLNNQKKNIHDVLFWDYPHYHGSGWTPGCAIRKGDWKLIHFYEDDHFELYNLQEDIGEINDLSVKQPEKVAELKKDLIEIKERTSAKEPGLNKI